MKIEKCAKLFKNRLITSNLKLVLAVVSRYRTEWMLNSELISEGILRLAKAAARYDYTHFLCAIAFFKHIFLCLFVGVVLYV
ncbi:hypothetical protein EON65_36265 [archaeon]|nr:MAG: hypothetical protein EON65_36265 [archaeon]